MAEYIIDVEGESAIIDGRLHIPIEVSLCGASNKPARIDIVVDNKLTPYVKSEAYQRGYADAKHECQDCQKIMMDAEQERVDKAYQQGLNDAENRRVTCEFCGYVNKGEHDEPCKFCANNYLNMFRPRKDNKLIRESIKDIMDSLDCTISDFEKAIEEIKNEAD